MKVSKKPAPALYFIGIGGESMSALAALCLSFGYRVCGSDREERPALSTLRKRGARVYLGHDEAFLSPDTDLVVYTLAVSEENPVYQKAKSLGIPIVSRAQFLGALLTRYQTTVGVCGSHGKSGTVALLTMLLAKGGKHPSALSGAKLTSGENFRIDGREYLVFEGCEYRDSFLYFAPSYLCILNMEWDHADYFKTEASLCESFLAAANSTERAVLYNMDDEKLSALMKRCRKPTVSVGRGKAADFRIEEVLSDGGFYRFRLSHGGESVPVSLSVPGAFQVNNAALALSSCWLLGLSPEWLKTAASEYHGIERRLERRTVGGRVCYYDYAHHPTEIAATVETVKAMTGGAVSVVFSPHTYSRTAAFFEGFATALGKADRVYLTEIYAAREAPIGGVTSEALAKAIGEKARVVTAKDREKIRKFAPGTLVFMGAGDLFQFLLESDENRVDKTPFVG